MPDFNALKLIWPAGKRGSLAVAQKRWAKLSAADQAHALEGAHRARELASWRDGFIPHIATYLNQRRWEDLIEARDEPDELTAAETKAWIAYSRRVGSWKRYECLHVPECETGEKHRRRIVDWLMASGWG